MSFLAWPDIEGFHHVRKAATKYPHILGGTNTVRYRGKVKLHGTNAGVQVRSNNVFAQSRTATITPGNDNAGFATWVEQNKQAFLDAAQNDGLDDVIIYGEWCGPGIQRGVAVNQIPKRCFAVFAASRIDSHGQAVDELITSPEELASLTEGVPDVYVLPWYGDDIDVPWLEEAEKLQPIVEHINTLVAVVEAQDPWVEKTFGVTGTGEGIVYYPISHKGRESFSNIAFKAKGDKHKVVSKAQPAQVDASVASGIDDFAVLVLAEARLEQGARTVSGGEMKCEMRLVGPFMAWIAGDVQKECKDELEASGLTWKQVQKAVSDRARSWYVERAKAL